MSFKDYFYQIDRAKKAPVTGDAVNFEINSVKVVKSSVVEHTHNSITVLLDDVAWNELDQMHLLSEGAAQQMAEFTLMFERDGQRIHKKFLHQPPMESAGITADFVRNIAKSNQVHSQMATEGYKLKKAEARLIETDQLPESEVAVTVVNPQGKHAKVTFECHFKKTTADRSRMFLESYDCTSTDAANHWSLPVKTWS
jgi:hypothetical protein